MAAVEFKRMIDLNFSSICELLPASPRSVQNLISSARDYIRRMKEDFKDQPEKYAIFSRRLQEAAYRSIAVVLDECGSPAIRLEGVPPGELERIRASLEEVGADSFLPRKFEDFDELPGSVDEEVVSKWCSLIAKIGGKLSGSGRCKYGLLRELSNFNHGLINRCELVVIVADMIREYPDLVQEFGLLLSPIDHDDENGEGGFESNCSSDLTEENGRKRKRVAEAHQRKQRKQRNKAPCRQTSQVEEADMCYADILECRLGQAIRYASQILHGASDTNEQSAYFRASKACFERIVKEMYDDEGPKVIAMTEEDPVNTLPAVISRLQRKEREHKIRKHRLRSRISARASRK